MMKVGPALDLEKTTVGRVNIYNLSGVKKWVRYNWKKRDPKTKGNILHFAVFMKRPSHVKFLMEEYPALMKQKDAYGMKPVDLAKRELEAKMSEFVKKKAIKIYNMLKKA
jgi:hypothetical protein